MAQHSIEDNPPTKPNRCVIVDVMVDAQECKTDAQKMEGETKLDDPKGQDSTMELTGGGVTQPSNTKEPNSTKEPEGAKPCTDQGTPDEPRLPVPPRPIAPRGANKATMRYKLPPDPLSILPTTPSPAIPPHNQKVPPTTPKANGLEQV